MYSTKKIVEAIPSENTFIEWAEREHEGLDLTVEEAGLLLGHIMGHGCGVCLNSKDSVLLFDVEDPDNGFIAEGFEELVDQVRSWNYEFVDDPEVVGAAHEQALMDAELIDQIRERVESSVRCGKPLGILTVKELIAELSKLPEDYRVTCCGAESYLYRFNKERYITIDTERYLDC